MNAAAFCRRSEGKVVSLNLYEEHESASFHDSTRKSGHILESRV